MQPIPATVANMATYARAGLVLLDPATGETFSATPGDYFMRDRDETMTNTDGEPLVLAIRHAEHAAPLYETPDAPTVSERIRANRERYAARLEELRAELRAERISYGELAELQSLADHIDPDDVELLEAAGVPEHDEERATVTLYAEEPGATLEVVRGQYVVFDPTGRDLPDCFLVGKVERIDSEGFAIVKPNGSDDRHAVDRLAAVLTA